MLSRFVCSLFGHKWVNLVNGWGYPMGAQCRRCGKKL